MEESGALCVQKRGTLIWAFLPASSWDTPGKTRGKVNLSKMLELLCCDRVVSRSASHPLLITEAFLYYTMAN